MNSLTIIVPVFNRENTIKRALDSIIAQLDEIEELMIINDGSTDKTQDVIKEYTNKYPEKITYYFKENEGIAATRNFGIQHAKGNYIMFVDSDDYIDISLVKKLQTYMQQNKDIIKFKSKSVDKDGKIIEEIDGPIFFNVNGEEAFNKLAFTDVLLDSPCVYVLKKELFLKNNLFFRVGTYHEDFGLIPLILLSAKSVVSTDIYGYYYVQTQNSITRNNDYGKTIKKFEDTLVHYDNMLQFINSYDIKKKTKENIKIYYTNAVLLKLKTINKEGREKYIQQIKKKKMINNIKIRNIKQFIKRIILSININWYLKLLK